MGVLAPADADMFWRSRIAVNDQFLLYGFAAERGARARAEPVLDELRQRAEGVADLHLRVAPAPADLAFPRWCPAVIDDDAVVLHPGIETWDRCRAAVAALLTRGVDATVLPWRLHLFGPVSGAPRADGPAWIVVFQVSHTLADGRRAAALARALFRDRTGEAAASFPDDPAPSRPPGPTAALLGAAQIPVRLAAGLGLGLLAWQREPERTAPRTMPASVFNQAAGARRRIDVLVLETAALRAAAVGGPAVGGPADGAVRPSVTAAFLTLLAEVLAEALPATPLDRLAVELTVGIPRSGEAAAPGGARNDFRTVAVALHPGLDRAERTAAIAAQIAAARTAAPAGRAGRWAAAVTPPVLRATAARLAAGAPTPEEVAGATVVSSVHRGAADLRLADGSVLFTAGFPALSAAHATTIGLHGLGDAVTVSLTTDPEAVADADRLVGLLTAATAP
ncbi:MAG: hypothetical protein QM809_09105 [Gordonia sp. (in: high G+C Gram-positive bacteria)]|uniref:hypothetical protein n=1 Tax=Gordonia sp. (in: high G+C Gram-positive bacteria) TaxID=84139 RepID=UPI0039E5BA77